MQQAMKPYMREAYPDSLVGPWDSLLPQADDRSALLTPMASLDKLCLHNTSGPLSCTLFSPAYRSLPSVSTHGKVAMQVARGPGPDHATLAFLPAALLNLSSVAFAVRSLRAQAGSGGGRHLRHNLHIQLDFACQELPVCPPLPFNKAFEHHGHGAQQGAFTVSQDPHRQPMM